MIKTHKAETPIILMRGITKIYKTGSERLFALNDIDLIVSPGDYLSVLGPSGSGKSTLMNIIGCLDTRISGVYKLNGLDTRNMKSNELAIIRNQQIGFVFQNHQLLPRLTAAENVELPMIYAGIPRWRRKKKVLQALQEVGLSKRVNHMPSQLSGGQQQRVAIARAIVNGPSLLLADEPTGALDQKTGRQIMDIFNSLNEQGCTIVMITHDINVAKNANRIVKIIDGKIYDGE